MKKFKMLRLLSQRVDEIDFTLVICKGVEKAMNLGKLLANHFKEEEFSECVKILSNEMVIEYFYESFGGNTQVKFNYFESTFPEITLELCEKKLKEKKGKERKKRGRRKMPVSPTAQTRIEPSTAEKAKKEKQIDEIKGKYQESLNENETLRIEKEQLLSQVAEKVEMIVEKDKVIENHQTTLNEIETARRLEKEKFQTQLAKNAAEKAETEKRVSTEKQRIFKENEELNGKLTKEKKENSKIADQNKTLKNEKNSLTNQLSQKEDSLKKLQKEKDLQISELKKKLLKETENVAKITSERADKEKMFDEKVKEIEKMKNTLLENSNLIERLEENSQISEKKDIVLLETLVTNDLWVQSEFLQSHKQTALYIPPESMKFYDDKVLGESQYKIIKGDWVKNVNLYGKIGGDSYDEPVAVKVIRFGESSDPEGTILKEVKRVKAMDHPNVVTVHGYTVRKYQDKFKDGRKVVKEIGVVMEKMDDSLEGFISRKKNLSREQTFFIFEQMIRCMCYLHNEMNIVHLDIKPSNFLIKEPTPSHPLFAVRLTDFGTSRNDETFGKGTTLSKNIGTFLYQTPEHLTDSVCKGSDIFSLGLSFYRLLTGAPLYSIEGKDAGSKDLKLENRFDAVTEAKYFRYYFELAGFEKVTKTSFGFLKDLIQKCLVFDLKDRLTASQLLAEFKHGLLEVLRKHDSEENPLPQETVDYLKKFREEEIIVADFQHLCRPNPQNCQTARTDALIGIANNMMNLFENSQVNGVALKAYMLVVFLNQNGDSILKIASSGGEKALKNSCFRNFSAYAIVDALTKVMFRDASSLFIQDENNVHFFLEVLSRYLNFHLLMLIATKMRPRRFFKVWGEGVKGIIDAFKEKYPSGGSTAEGRAFRHLVKNIEQGFMRLFSRKDFIEMRITPVVSGIIKIVGGAMEKDAAGILSGVKDVLLGIVSTGMDIKKYKDQFAPQKETLNAKKILCCKPEGWYINVLRCWRLFYSLMNVEGTNTDLKLAKGCVHFMNSCLNSKKHGLKVQSDSFAFQLRNILELLVDNATSPDVRECLDETTGKLMMFGALERLEGWKVNGPLCGFYKMKRLVTKFFKYK